MGNSDHQSKIIKISLLTNNLGDGIDDLNELNTSDMAWLNLSSDIEIDDKYFQIIFEDKNLLPWKLIKKIN